MTRISDPHFAERVRASFELQNAMNLIQATMPLIEHGYQTLWVNRSNQPFEELGTQPTRIGSSLRDVLGFFPVSP